MLPTTRDLGGFDKGFRPCYLIEKPFGAPIAQLDRAPDYESVGRVFESPWARQLNQGVRQLL
jgi:hypothetical protein